MSADRLHARARELFLAIQHLPDSARQAELQRRCPDDPQLRAEVLSLLQFRDHTMAGTLAERHGSLGTELETGALFAERYRIVSMLGAGGMGEVYRAHDTILDLPVALKLVRPGPHSAERSQLINEVRLARGINHPAVCRVFDVGEWQGRVFFTMEYVDGEDLGAHLRRLGRLPPDTVVRLAGQLCGGLAAAHARGVLHRDLKPGNIMVDGRGRVRITDFGIATSTREHPAPGSGPPALAGTPGYMAPEQLGGDTPVSEQTDLYALGLVLYELLTGRPALASEPLGTLLRRTQRPRIRPPSALVAGIPEPLERIILHALQPDPARRPASALAMAAALPGIDPVQLAAEAGIDGAGELERSARGGSLPRWAALVLLIATLLATLLLVDRSDEEGSFSHRGPRRDPALVAEHAADILHQLGRSGEPHGQAFGLMADPRYPATDDRVLFWYRELAPAPATPFVHQVLLTDAELSTEAQLPGGSLVLLDRDEHLVYLRHRSDAGQQPPTGEPDWQPALSLAGLDRALLQPAAPRAPSLWADRLAAWEGPDADGNPVRVDAAAVAGRVVELSVQPLPTAGATGPAEQQQDHDRNALIGLALFVLALVAVAVPTVRNLRRRRADRTEARRLLLAWTPVAFAAFLLAPPSHPLDHGVLPVLWYLLGLALQMALLWACHVASEPDARRCWPLAWHGWSQALGGRLATPRSGAALLAGAAAGTLLALATSFLFSTPASSTLAGLAAPSAARRLAVGLSWHAALATLLGLTAAAVLAAFVKLFGLVLLTRWLRRPSLATAAYLLAGALLGLPLVQSSPTGALLGLAAAGTALALLHHTGPLGLVIAGLTQSMLLLFPMTDSYDTWYAGSSVLAMTLASAMPALGYLLSRRGFRRAPS